MTSPYPYKVIFFGGFQRCRLSRSAQDTSKYQKKVHLTTTALGSISFCDGRCVKDSETDFGRVYSAKDENMYSKHLNRRDSVKLSLFGCVDLIMCVSHFIL